MEGKTGEDGYGKDGQAGMVLCMFLFLVQSSVAYRYQLRVGTQSNVLFPFSFSSYVPKASLLVFPTTLLYSTPFHHYGAYHFYPFEDDNIKTYSLVLRPNWIISFCFNSTYLVAGMASPLTMVPLALSRSIM